MPIARFEMPDGRVARFEVPEGTSPEQAQTMFDRHMSQSQVPQEPPASPQSQLTSAQQAYMTARPYVEPTLSALGMIGGGIVGTGAGAAAGGVMAAPGAVAGAGLGYAGAQELMQIADTAMGVRSPRQGMQNVVEPVKNVLTGAELEMGGQIAGKLLAPVFAKGAYYWNKLRHGATEKASSIARGAAGTELEQIKTALSNAKGEPVTPGQATAHIESPTWQALVDEASSSRPATVSKKNVLLQAQEAESRNALAKLAGGATETDVRAGMEGAKESLKKVTDPMRKNALARANLGATVAELESLSSQMSDDAAKQVQKVRELMDAGKIAEAAARSDVIKKGLPPGIHKYHYFTELSEKAFGEWADKAATASLDLGAGARFANDAAKAMRAQGIAPLKVDNLVRTLKTIPIDPGYAGNDLITNAVKGTVDDILQFTNSNGVIDARALDAIRKNSVNAVIQRMRPGADATTQRNLAAQVMSQVKPVIDDAIIAAGGKGYKEYLKTFENGMRQIAETKLTGQAFKLWKTNKDAFVALVQNESPKVVEKVLGPGNYNIAVELSENTMGVLREQAAKAVRDASVTRQSSDGQKALGLLVQQHMAKIKLPSLLNRWVASANKGLEQMEQIVGRKTMDKLAQAMQTPEGARDLLRSLPEEQQAIVLQLISDPSKWGIGAKGMAGSAALGTRSQPNALSSDDQNALSR